MQKIRKANCFIITGGPGMGKTTLIEELSRAGYTCVSETGRKIIKHEIEAGGTALPWMNKFAFADKMLSLSVNDFTKVTEMLIPVFFDRGIPDVAGYMELSGMAISEETMNTVRKYNYNSKVFITPPWEEIYKHDTERRQTFDEAIETYRMMTKIYSALGYELIELPKTPVRQRMVFVLENINA